MGELKRFAMDLKDELKAINKRRLYFYVAFCLTIGLSLYMATWPDDIMDRMINLPFGLEPMEFSYIMIWVMLDVGLLLFFVGLFLVPKSKGVYAVLILLLIPHFLLFMTNLYGVPNLLEAFKMYVSDLSLGLINIP